MPTYEYVCEKCGHEFEASQTMTAAPLKICPQESCAKKTWGRGRVKKQISSGAGLLFKGSGFYITDYRSDKYKASAKSDQAPAVNPAAKETSTPASSPAATPAPAAKPPPKADKK